MWCRSPPDRRPRFLHGLSADDLVAGDDTLFIATGVSDGGLIDGVRLVGSSIRTESVVLRSRSGTFRRIVSEHDADRWL